MSDEIFKKIFSKNLQYYMELTGKTQTDIINDLGFDKSAVSTWVKGTRLPRMDKVDALAKYFGIMRSNLIEDRVSDLSSELSDKETELIDLFRLLDPEDRAEALGYIKGMLRAQKYRTILDQDQVKAE